jgi:hypothetical protein
MNTQSIVKNDKLPEFIRNHEIFKKIDKVNKIFPLIGLKNGSESIGSLNYAAFAASFAKKELTQMFNPRQCWHNRDRAQKIYNVLRDCTEKDFIIDKKLTLTPKKLKKIGVRNIKEAYNKCMFPPYDRYNIYGHDDGDDDFSHFPNIKNSWRIVFSSSDDVGVWDIATMSMRGIDSCQSWDGSYRRNLIGSIIDPFVAVIYVTNNKNYYKLGKEMIYRCVVRYVVNQTTNKPALLLEPMYHQEDEYDYSDSLEAEKDMVIKLFQRYLEKHLTKKNAYSQSASQL